MGRVLAASSGLVHLAHMNFTVVSFALFAGHYFPTSQKAVVQARN